MHYGCPHLDEATGQCRRRDLPCSPAATGCVLHGKAVIAEEPPRRKSRKKAPAAPPTPAPPP